MQAIESPSAAGVVGGEVGAATVESPEVTIYISTPKRDMFVTPSDTQLNHRPNNWIPCKRGRPLRRADSSWLD